MILSWLNLRYGKIEVDGAMGTYLENHKESPDQTDEEFRQQIWDYVIQKTGNQQELNLESCIGFLDLLKIHDLMMKYKVAFKLEFDRVVKWFVENYLKIMKKVLKNGTKINLFDLYLHEWERNKWKRQRVCANHVNNNQARTHEPSEEEPDDTNVEDSKDFILIENEDGEHQRLGLRRLGGILGFNRLG
ncbi:hypothetical protein L1987_58652 [Smallanthus sonchifolius]|uniref:Uncharacterized protein n=1 Tax=Smallanthus sonchifolius TaxID=185202 RepID=A0ACB9DFU5_9ASTR|nr:hypothetical protein L1987_58652 [Smallanthus sonchifolius]